MRWNLCSDGTRLGARSLCAVSALALASLLVQGGTARAQTIVEDISVGAGTFSLNLIADCPADTVATGGGVDVTDETNMLITASAPRLVEMGTPGRLFGLVPGERDAPVGWGATSRNDGSNQQTAVVAAVCQAVPDAVTVVEEGIANPGELGIGIARCPQGTIPIGGGVDVFNVLEMTVRSSAPIFPNPDFFPGSGQQPDLFLRDIEDGSAPAPTGWEATVFNPLGEALEFTVAAICKAAPEAVTVVASAEVPGNGIGVAEALCPDGLIAGGGGADVTLTSLMPLTSSTPLLPGGPSGTRPIDVMPGAQPDPIGWRATARNDFDEQRTVKVAAICVPEPSGLLLGLGALATLGVLARRGNRGA